MLSHHTKLAVLLLKHSSDVWVVAKICITLSHKHETGSTCCKTHVYSISCVCTWMIFKSCFFFYYITVFVCFAQATAKGFVLIQTKEVSMRPEDVKRVFQNSAEDLVEWITKGNFFVVFFCVCFFKFFLSGTQTGLLLRSYLTKWFQKPTACWFAFRESIKLCCACYSRA